MKRVLVLDANQRSALSTTRSLGKRGIPIFTADETRTSLSGCSKFSQQYFVYPSPQNTPDKFIAVIIQLVNEHKIKIILPMTELTTELLLQNREQLSDVLLPFPDLSTINSLADKCSLMRLAESLNVPYPNTWFVDKYNELPVKLNDLAYPIVIKPSKSWLQLEGRWIHTTVQFASTPEAAQQLINTDPCLQSHPFMLQACIEGTGQGVFALYNNGTPIIFFSHRRIREKPPWGGVSVLSESISVNSQQLAYAQSLLNAVSWNGIAMVEFKVSADGTPYLMEVNTRFWGSLQLAIDSGVDFPWLLYKIACNETINPVPAYQIGRRLRWILGDLDSLYITLRNKSYPVTRKIKILIQFFLFYNRKTKHEINRWNDLKPFYCELTAYIRSFFSKTH